MSGRHARNRSVYRMERAVVFAGGAIIGVFFGGATLLALVGMRSPDRVGFGDLDAGESASATNRRGPDMLAVDAQEYCRQRVFRALSGQKHQIDDDQIVFHRNPNEPGNASQQFCEVFGEVAYELMQIPLESGFLDDH